MNHHTHLTQPVANGSGASSMGILSRRIEKMRLIGCYNIVESVRPTSRMLRAYAPIPIQLNQDSQTSRQLNAKEGESLFVGYVTSCQRSFFRPRWQNLFSVNLYSKKSSHTDRFIEVLVPHVVDRAPSSSHHKRTQTKETEIGQWGGIWQFKRVGRHCN